MKGEVFAILLLAGSAAPLMAQQSAVPAVGQDAQRVEETGDAAKKDEKVCKVMAVSGTRFKSRLCYTQQEWDAIDRAHKDKVREIDSQPIRQRSEGG